MIRTSIRVCAIALCSSALLLAGCSGSRDETLNTQNIGRSDAAVTVDDDAEVDAEAEGDAGEDAGEEIVVIEVEDAGAAPDVTVIVEVVLCGNGQLDADEECDQGASNSNTAMGACRLNCRRARCGDGVVDQGEVCDEGPNNSDTAVDACRLDCRAARCGDGVVDRGEQCDSGDARSDSAPGACRSSCQNARCGDGVVDTDEGCDDGNQNDGDACRNVCASARCGDGAMDDGEQCDDGNTVNTDACRNNCRRPTCGDRVVDSGEQCDDGNTVNNDGCRMCQTGCRGPDECTDRQVCNGVERCVDGVCMAALRPLEIDDRVGCTDDACSEAAGVTHTANDRNCTAPGPTCGDVNGVPTSTTSSVRCDLTRGCIVSGPQTPCRDQATACGRSGSRLMLISYEPACNPDAMSCGEPQAETQDCGPAEGSCSRDGIYTPAGSCSVREGTCEAPDTQDCNGQSWRCASDNSSATPTNGTCNRETGCGMATGEPVPCSDPADTCERGMLRVWTPACGSGGCGTATSRVQSCPGTARTVCGAFGPNREAALQDYAPACADGASCATSAQPTGDPRVCTPDAPSSCGAGPNGPQQVNYAPLCTNGTCSSRGQPSDPVQCTASSRQRCETVGGLGRRFFFQPSCDRTSSACLPDGFETSEPCPALTGTFCRIVEGRASLVRYQAACRDGSCAPDGQIDTTSASPCATRPVGCANRTTEARWNNECSNNQCATTNVSCDSQAAYCSNNSIVRNTGICTDRVGCATTTVESCAASCGPVPGAAGPMFCPAGSCSQNANGAFSCNRTCTACVTGCERTSAGANTGRLCEGCGVDARGAPTCVCAQNLARCPTIRAPTGVGGGVLDPNIGATSPGTLTTAPGAGVLGQ